MNRVTAVRAHSTVLLVGLALILAACSTGAAPAPTVTASPVPTPAATPTAAPTSTTITEADNGRTLTVPVGSEVTLELGNTYWQVGDSSDPAVLKLTSGPTASAAMGACVAGAGCGTVTAVYRAIAPGRADITAARTSCGEAMQCTGTAGAYAVTVVVGG
jgi:hypothetical protein